MLHSLKLYNIELEILRSALELLDAFGMEKGSNKLLRGNVKTLDIPDLLERLTGIGGTHRVFNVADLELMASALVYWGTKQSPPPPGKLAEETRWIKFDNLCKLLAEHLGRKFY